MASCSPDHPAFHGISVAALASVVRFFMVLRLLQAVTGFTRYYPSRGSVLVAVVFVLSLLFGGVAVRVIGLVAGASTYWAGSEPLSVGPGDPELSCTVPCCFYGRRLVFNRPNASMLVLAQCSGLLHF